MASTINSTTSSGVVITSDNTGSLALQSAGTTIATISSTGLTMNSGNIIQASGAAPAFSAYSAANQNPTTATWTKVIFGTEVFDTNNNFASSTFTPTVAGYYQVSASISMAADTVQTIAGLLFYKNGAATISNVGTQIPGVSSVTYLIPSASALVYMNGTTDYLEVYGLVTGTGTLRYFFLSQPNYPTVFTGFLARSA